MNTPPRSAQPWLVWPRPNPRAALRLFCLPHAGGGASLFRNWPSGLPAGVEVCAVQLPGRETRFSEPPFTRWQPLISKLAEVLLPLIDRPYAVYGHSMGALLGFELVRQLRRMGIPEPARLFVAASGGPPVPPTEPDIHTLPEAEFRAELRRRQGTPAAVLDNDDLMDALAPMLRADFAICDTYAYQPEAPLTCAVAALGGQDDVTVPQQSLARWGEMTASGFEMTLLPGGHFFPTSQPAPLLDYLRRKLNGVLGGPCGDWQKPGRVGELANDEVHVWRIALDRSEEEIARLGQLLGPAEQERAGRFRFLADRNRFIVGRGVLRTLLGRYVGQAPAQIQFRYAGAGKPFLREHTLQFNLAHSGKLALLAVAGQRTVGVDVEQMRQSLEVMTICDRYFEPEEQALLRAETGERQRTLFFMAWTRKEAYMKATGLGLYMPLDEFGVLPAPGTGALRLQLQKNPAESAGWSVRDLEPGPGYAGAVAVAGHDWKLCCLEEPGPG